ncbi:hypothetical protein Acr_08g0012160 [Actinidia rufa]|uniref:Uncharacterized protein n=1 Tax=Actinidia rufa TaxID=165716 RepID=A0A7J0F2D0_9ERIC|nr:hypothetical protein Acr_08g0012160 [Actinidia rufa]
MMIVICSLNYNDFGVVWVLQGKLKFLERCLPDQFGSVSTPTPSTASVQAMVNGRREVAAGVQVVDLNGSLTLRSSVSCRGRDKSVRKEFAIREAVPLLMVLHLFPNGKLPPKALLMP